MLYNLFALQRSKGHNLPLPRACHSCRRGCALYFDAPFGRVHFQVGRQRKAQSARQDLRQDNAPGRAFFGRYVRSGTYAGIARRGGTAGYLLFAVSAAVLLFYDCALIAVRYLRSHRVENRARTAGVRAAYSAFHRGGEQVCEKDFRQILGKVHFHGRQLFGQRAGA